MKHNLSVGAMLFFAATTLFAAVYSMKYKEPAAYLTGFHDGLDSAKCSHLNRDPHNDVIHKFDVGDGAMLSESYINFTSDERVVNDVFAVCAVQRRDMGDLVMLSNGAKRDEAWLVKWHPPLSIPQKDSP